jgi:maltose/moltooligosaccharide transporter
MSTLSPAAPSDAVPAGPKIFRCGTLTYTQGQLFQLFFTLCWNDFTLMLLENVNAFGKNLQIEHGASYAEIGWFGMIGTFANIIINPTFSVWSDRTRTTMGRRRPFLLACAPPLALCILAVPYMPDIYQWLVRFPVMASIFQHVPMNGAAFMIGVDMTLLGIFNAMMLALFSYLYWDVVPQEVLGRWTALVAIMSNASVLIWGFFLQGYAVHHMKTLCVVVSIGCLLIYMISTLAVKEGEYAKVDKHDKGGAIFAPIRAFFVECYSDPFYLWIFGAFFMAGLANASNDYKGYYLRYDLHADYDISGKINACSYVIPVLLGYFVGQRADKLHPIRMYVPTYCFWGGACFLAYFFIHNQTTFLVWSCIIQVAIFANGVTYGALLPQIYPRAKFGQFCAANQLLGSLGGFFVPVPVGYLFDYLHNNRFAYLFSACFLFAAALMFAKVQRNFSKRHGHIPVPHAG